MSLLSECPTDKLIEIVSSSFSHKEVLQKLGYTSRSGSIHTLLKERLEKENISTEHFSLNINSIKRTFENTFCKESTVAQKTLRNKYLQGEYSKYECSICGQKPIWQGKPLTLILDHINGINNDDRLENLRWVCPNCNQQLETTNGKNIKRLREAGLLEQAQAKKYYCQDCGKELSHSSATRCAECASKASRIVERPERDKLKVLIRSKPFTTIGTMYGVSDNSVRKWCKMENLPSTKKDINKYSDEDWNNL